MEAKSKTTSAAATTQKRGDPSIKPATATIPTLEFGEHAGSKYTLSVHSRFVCPDTEVFCVRFDAEDQLIAAGCSDGSVKIFNTQTGKLEHSLIGYTGMSQTPTTSLRWRPAVHSRTKQVLVSVNSDGSVVHWHAPSGKQLHKMAEADHSILCMDYNQDGSMFVTAGKDFHVRLYDEDTKSVSVDFSAAEWNSPGHSNRVFAAKFVSTDPNLLVSGGWDSNVHIWDIRDRRSIATIFGPSLSGDSLDIKNGLILTGSYRNDTQVQLWDFKTRKLFQEVPWTSEAKAAQLYVYASQFSKSDNNTITAGSSGVNELVVFDAKNGYKPCSSIVNLAEGVYGVDYANRSSKFAFSGGDGIISIMQLS